MRIKTRKHFNEIIQSLTEEILDEEELDEMTVTGNVDGYNTPFAFTGKAGKKRKKRIATNSTGYEPVNENFSGISNKSQPLFVLTKHSSSNFLFDGI